LAVVTNQPDVGNGLVDRSEVDAMHEIITRELPVDAIKACFHRQIDDCNYRKRKPDMILEAASEVGADLTKSFMLGARASVEAGRAAGCATVFIDLGYALPPPDSPDYVARSIAEAADLTIETVLTAQEGP
jgi:D-glycero-D-manno-heptose 1,7-bisphosphate phosphatase